MNVLEARKLLGVPITASSDEVTKAYRHRVYLVHPDRNPSDTSAGEKVVRLTEAYATLRRAATSPARRWPQPGPDFWSERGPAWEWFHGTDAQAAGDPNYKRGDDPLTDLINDIRTAVHNIDPKAVHVAAGMAIGVVFLTIMTSSGPSRPAETPKKHRRTR